MYDIFIPKSKELRKYIHNFFVLKEFKGDLNYLAFPSNSGAIIGLYTNAQVLVQNHQIKIGKADDTIPQVLLLGRYKIPVQLQYDCYVPEISINFTHTGLNYFFKKNAKQVARKAVQTIDDKLWTTLSSEMFHLGSTKDKIQFLEDFLLTIKVDKDLSKVEKCVMLLEQNTQRSIVSIAKEMNVSPKTITRWFVNYVGCAPIDFKKVLRFRKAISTKLKDPSKNLSDICYESNYYDSPHFTREFKKLTTLNPKEFFLEIKTVTNINTPYKFS